MRRADAGTEAGTAAPLAGMETLRPSAHAVRVDMDAGQASIVDGPFAEVGELIAGFGFIEADSREAALEQLRRWPLPPGCERAELELRQSGCHGGCAQVEAAAGADASGQRYIVLLRSSAELESEADVAQEVLDRLDAHNAAEARAGVLLAADGLRASALGARVTLAAGKASLIDGPFTEIKELVAGYWMVRAPCLQDVIAWALRNPYPTGPRVQVEIRELDEAATAAAAPPFTAAMRAAEQRMREQQLEAALSAQLAGR